MEFLGVGPSELVFIVIIALIILGPKDMQKAGRTIGKWLRSIVTSDGWKIFQQTSQELRTLPNRLMREANQDLNQIGKELNSAVSPGPRKEDNTSVVIGTPDSPVKPQSVPSSPTPVPPPENKIAPPAAESTPDKSDQNKNA